MVMALHAFRGLVLLEAAIQEHHQILPVHLTTSAILDHQTYVLPHVDQIVIVPLLLFVLQTIVPTPAAKTVIAKQALVIIVHTHTVMHARSEHAILVLLNGATRLTTLVLCLMTVLPIAAKGVVIVIKTAWWMLTAASTVV